MWDSLQAVSSLETSPAPAPPSLPSRPTAQGPGGKGDAAGTPRQRGTGWVNGGLVKATGPGIARILPAGPPSLS